MASMSVNLHWKGSTLKRPYATWERPHECAYPMHIWPFQLQSSLFSPQVLPYFASCPEKITTGLHVADALRNLVETELLQARKRQDCSVTWCSRQRSRKKLEILPLLSQ